MSEAYVHHLSWALGNQRDTIQEAAARNRLTSSSSALAEAGFTVHYWCDDTTSAYDLAQAAVEPLRDQLVDVGCIIYSTCIPLNGNCGSQGEFARSKDVKHLMDFPASRLQADFNLDGSIVIGLNQQACTGMLGALRLARSLVAAEPDMNNILCVTSDRFPPDSLYEQSYNLISDGAAVCLISRDYKGFGLRIVSCHQVTNGAMSLASDDETVGSFFTWGHRIIKTTVERAGLSISDIKWIVPQNTHAKAWQILASLIEFNPDRVYFPTLREVAHVISGDNIINLKRLMDEGKLEPGDLILLFMAGYGLNWQCVILEAGARS